MVRQFLFHVQGVGHHHRRPRLESAPERDDGLRQVGHHDGHAVACLQPHFSQRSSEALGLFPELGVRQREVLETDGPALPEFVRGFIQERLERTGDDVGVQRCAFLYMRLPCNVFFAHAKPLG